MLELIRKYRAVFMIIFLLSAVGMVITMFGTPARRSGMSLSGLGMSSDVAAKVEGEEISSSELVNAVNRQMEQMEDSIQEQVKNAPNKAQARKFLEQIYRSQITPDRILDQMIQEKFRVVTADKAGITTPPNAILDKIQSNPVFQKNGHFDPLLYKQMVLQPKNYENYISMQNKMEELGRAFANGLGVMSPEEERLGKLLETHHSYETLAVNPLTFPEPKSVSDAEVKTFLADPSSAMKLQSYYDRNMNKFQQEEQVHARHILIPEDQGGQKKIQEVLADIKAGKITFAEAAKKYSTDKSNSNKGGDLGFFGKGTMDPAFEKAAFALTRKDEISEPVKSSFGYHIIQLVDRKPAVKRSFEEAKAEIAPQVLLEQKREAKAHDWVKALTLTGQLPSDAELKKMGLSWSKAEWSPLDESVGAAPVGSHTAELVALSLQKPVLPAPLTQGDSLVIVRRVADSSKDTHTAKNDAKKAPAADTAETDKDPELAKAESAFGYYLRNRFEKLQKENKIVRSERLLAALRESMNNNEGGR
jgi:peptidyl-prolyl cis-trans isomerase D